MVRKFLKFRIFKKLIKAIKGFYLTNKNRKLIAEKKVTIQHPNKKYGKIRLI